MNSRIAAVLLAASALAAAAHAQEALRISLREAVEMALERNPDLLLARLETEKAAQQANVLRSGLRSPSAYAGSGLGATSGIPQSVEGSSPSVVQATGRTTIYDRSLSKRIEEARAMSEASNYNAAAKEDEIAYRVAETFLDLELASRQAGLARQRAESHERVVSAVRARADEGREIALGVTRARIDLEQSRRELGAAENRQRILEARLRGYLGLSRPIRLIPSGDEPSFASALPATAGNGADRALANSAELRSLEARVRAKEFSVEAEAGARYPRMDLVAQYALLARFNNYDQFFNRFQRHNGQAGIALSVPLFQSKTISSRVSKARLDAREALLERDARRAQIETESTELFYLLQEAEAGQRVARLELDYARENLGVLLAQYEEGLLAAEDLERGRAFEAAAWDRYYEAQYAVRKARLNLLRRTGELAAALR